VVSTTRVTAAGSGDESDDTENLKAGTVENRMERVNEKLNVDSGRGRRI
jgi:hypothetical protein